MMNKKTILILLGITTLFSLILFSHNKQSGHTGRSLASMKKTIILGVDGVAYNHFLWAQQEKGLFKQFKNVSMHVAPFPSLSDHSWNIITQARKVHGKRGKLKHAEAAYFDDSTQTVISDTRDYFRRLGQKNHYMGAFSVFMNPFIESLLYVPSQKLPLEEVKHIKQGIIESGTKPLVAALLVGTDSVAHLHKYQLFPLFQAIDSMVKDLENYYKEQGIDAEIILVSDHGMAKRFIEGGKEIELLTADISLTVQKAGLTHAEKLLKENDVAVPVLALGNVTGLYFKDLSKREKILPFLKAEPWLDLAIYISKRTENKLTLEIVNSQAKATLDVEYINGIPRYIYKADSLNPLKIPAQYLNRTLSDSEAKIATSKTPYPDSLHRLFRSALGEDSVFPDMMITLKDAYCLKGGLSTFAQMIRTHGSLSFDSSIGIVTSNHLDRKLPSTIRAEQFLDVLQVDPHKLFTQDLPKGFLSSFKTTFEKLTSSSYEGIDTENQVFSDTRILGLINNFINYSKYVFDIPTLQSLFDLYSGNKDQLLSKGNTPSFSDFDLEKVMTKESLGPADIGVITDVVLTNSDLDKVLTDPRIKKIKAKLERAFKISPKATSAGSLEDLMLEKRDLSTGSKRIVMKSYASTYLLDKALTIPEFPFLEDTRDIRYAEKWLNQKKSVIADPATLSKVTPKLFYEIFNERKLAHEIYPVEMPLIYNPLANDREDLTLVYIPGIYNSIFDNEIFKIGLDTLANNLGTRIIAPPVLSGCSSQYNSKIIYDYLQEDIRYRNERGLPPHKYFFWGYSKGGVDALHTFVNYPAFTRERVLGLMTIASPLHGSEILSKSDVPLTLLEMLSPEGVPEICKTTEKASQSITPDGMNRFYRDHKKELIGLTRYYSISFDSNIKDAHPWMKATKSIAQFKARNDGVVTVDSSRFPEEFQSIHLGTVNADHLAGIVASKFPQAAFMEALYLTMLEMDVFNEKQNAKWNEEVIYKSPFTSPSTHQGILKEKIGAQVAQLFNKKNLDKKRVSVLELGIKQALIGTPYALSDFHFKLSGDKVVITYSKPLSDMRFVRIIKHTATLESASPDEIIKHFLTKFQASGKDLLTQSGEIWRTYPVSSRQPLELPKNSLSYLPDYRINLRKIEDFFANKSVSPLMVNEYPKGLSILFDHPRMVDFRQEYQMNYEEGTTVVAPDDNNEQGWSTKLLPDGELYAQMASKNSSVRLTSFAFRFKPADFPNMELKMQVDNDVKNANALFGGTGKDDSAFQVWFTFRVLSPTQDRTKISGKDKLRIMGYYWGDAIEGQKLVIGEIYENYYSKKNFIIATLPEAKQLLLDFGPTNLSKMQTYKRSLKEDLQKAFPDLDASQIEIIGITLQHDSNDTKGDSLALFKYLKLMP